MESIHTTAETDERRVPLTRARVLEAAVDLADREGIDAVSMRRLGQELGVEAMSLYTHVRGKDDLLDGMVDAVVAEITVDAAGPDWRTTLRRHDPRRPGGDASSHVGGARHRDEDDARARRRSRYMEADRPGSSVDGGFTIDLTHHAMHVLGQPRPRLQPGPVRRFGRPGPEAAAAFAAQLAAAYPNIARASPAREPRGRPRRLRRRLRVRVRARPHPRRPRAAVGARPRQPSAGAGIVRDGNGQPRAWRRRLTYDRATARRMG